MTEANIDKRFWLKVKKQDGCWLWTGARMKSGYGHLSLGNGHNISAHRFSFILHRGKIPKKLYILHKCDNRLCVNPDHLFLGTHLENIKDMVKKRRNIWGEKCWSHKLDISKVEKIREIYNTKSLTQAEIAKKFEISTSVINSIVNNKSWKYMTKTNKIDKDAWFSMQAIVQGKLFPWAKTYPTVRKFVEHDQQADNFLKAIISGEGNAKKYRFKGENLIKFINAVEAGKVRL